MTQNSGRPFVIGITGGSGAGKGEVCRFLATRGMTILDTDKMAHEQILRGKPAYDEVLAAFGDSILGQDGQIDRKKLGAIVFADKIALARLSTIVHKYVQQECENIIARHTGPIVIDGAALVEAGMDKACDVVIGVFAPLKTRISRITARDNITPEAAARRISSQMPDETLRKFCHIMIENDTGLEELADKCSQIPIEEKGLL